MSEAKHAAILRWLSVAELDDVAVSCTEATLPGSIVLDRCLSETPLAWLAELATHATVHAAVEYCARTEAARNRLAEVAALTPRIRLDGGPGAGQQVHYSAPPARRRALFGLGAPAGPGPAGTHTQRLAAALAALPIDDNAPSQAANLSVTDACTACGVCVRSCPHQALELSVADGVATLSHELGACEGEDVCAAFCPVDAIVREVEHQWGHVRERPVIELKVLPVRSCAQCRAGFSTPDDATLCPVCRLQEADPFGVHLPPAARALLERRRRAAGRE